MQPARYFLLFNCQTPVHGNRSLVLKKIKGWDLKRVIYLSSNPSRYQTSLAKAFKQFLVRYFETAVINGIY